MNTEPVSRPPSPPASGAASPQADVAHSSATSASSAKSAVRETLRDLPALPLLSAGVVVGRIVAVDAEQGPWVATPLEAAGHASPARATCAIGPADVDREAVVVFEAGDPARPIILGLLQPRDHQREAIEVEVAGRRITVAAAEELVLRCGAASITLTAAGKVLIRGTYVLSRSQGANHLKGASIEIN